MTFPTKKTARPLAVSWSRWFANRVWQRRFILGMEPHNQHSWKRAMPTALPLTLPRVTSHAPWLNAECLAYNRAVGSQPQADGFYTS